MVQRARTWVVDLRHYLDDETGDLADMPGPALNCALYFSSIVAWVSDHMPGGEPHTNVPCWRRPGRKRCLGDIIAELHRAHPTSCGSVRCAVRTVSSVDGKARFGTAVQVSTRKKPGSVGAGQATPAIGARWL
jgi:hypothetical protein